MKKILFWAMVLFLFAACKVQQAEQLEQPNFVWIISEDNSKHYLELFDENGIATPHIEKLAENGITFTRAFSNAPVCSSARSTLITSCYGPRIGTQYHRKSKPVPLPEGVDMFPTYLRKAGYYTTNKSKTDYNAIANEGVWDESSKKAHWKNRAEGQPFFHKQSFAESHEGRLHFKKKLLETYAPTLSPESVFVNPNHPNTELFRFTNAFYRDKMLTIDEKVAEMVKELEEEGLLESTFVFYFGDHGGVLPGSKGYVYETGLHVPLVVRIPEKYKHLVNAKKGLRSESFVSFIDFGPTLLKLAGIDIPDGIDGKPFMGRGRSEQEIGSRDLTFGYADRFDEKYDLVRTVRKGKYKYMRNYQPFNPDGLHNFYRYKCLAYQEWWEMYQEGALDEVQKHFFESRQAEELFDIDTDPYETNNLADDPDYAEILGELRSALTGWVKDMPDLSFFPESELRKEAFDNPVVYGQNHKQEIATLIDVADLSLMPFDKAKTGIEAALNAKDPWKKYWGLIVCSSFAEEAADFYGKAKALTQDENLLVRTRAAEFLALTGQEDPAKVINDVLQKTADDMEATLILNTVVLLMDGSYAYNFEITEEMLLPDVRNGQLVKRRMYYILERQKGGNGFVN